MSPPLPRFTLRRLMVAVALAAVLLGVGRFFFQAVMYARTSYRHHALEITARDRWERERLITSKAPNSPAQPSLARETADYHATLKEKYRRAARNPWVPIAADPTPPE